MYVKAIKYKNVWLAPGSEAYELYVEIGSKPKNQEKLDKLIKECSDRKLKMEGK